MSSKRGHISVRDCGKCYEVYARPLDRLKQTLFRGKRQFFQEFWALRHVSFDLQPGEALGVIGRNGSGKSTLLQMLAGTLQPSEGQIEVSGRVAALLELGSGFNPDFTGRENVFLNGTILGLRTEEVEARFDEIAAFADIGDFLEQPVKTYSTGMAVRLAFAVQVLLEPEIFIVDEALAVGDASFQIKCMKRMRDLLDRGVSVILVTHDVNTVRSFCERVIWLDKGRLVEDGVPLEVTSRYMQALVGGEETAEAAGEAQPETPLPSETGAQAETDDALPWQRLDEVAGLVRWGSGEAQIESFRIHNGHGGQAYELGGEIHVEVEVAVHGDLSGRNLGFGFALRNTKGLDIVTYTTWEDGIRIKDLFGNDRLRLTCVLGNILAPGEYALVLSFEDVQGVERKYFDFVENATLLTIVAPHEVFSSVLPPVECRLAYTSEQVDRV